MSGSGIGAGDSVRMVTVTIRGTEEQISCAKQMIVEKVFIKQKL